MKNQKRNRLLPGKYNAIAKAAFNDMRERMPQEKYHWAGYIGDSSKPFNFSEVSTSFDSFEETEELLKNDNFQKFVEASIKPLGKFNLDFFLFSRVMALPIQPKNGFSLKYDDYMVVVIITPEGRWHSIQRVRSIRGWNRNKFER